MAYDDGIHLLAAGVPRMFLRKTYGSLVQMIQLFQEYLQNPKWEDQACSLTRQMVSIARNNGAGDRDCAA